jgi:hypothetical protein
MNIQNIKYLPLFIYIVCAFLMPQMVFAQRCYIEEGTNREVCAESTNADEPYTLPAANTSQSCTNCFEYKTLVDIPGLTNSEGKVVISPNSLGLFLQTVFNYIIGIAILLTVVMIVYGGVLYATAEAINGKSNAKKIITGALMGLALALGSVLILRTINPDLVKFSLGIDKLTLQGQSTGGTGRLVDLQVLQNGGAESGGTSGTVSGAQALAREEALIRAAKAAGITNINELAGLMGNAKHETANFRLFTEVGRGGGRHGNYYGRGYFQLTWQSNYRAYSSAAGVDLVANPDAALREDVSAKIAVAYWKDRVRQFRPETDLEAGGLGINRNEKRLYPARWANRQAAVRSYLNDPRLR